MRAFSAIAFFITTLPLFGQGDYHLLKDGTMLYVMEAGQGQTLLFIPGWTMTSRFFEKQQEYFSNNYQVISYDPRGQGHSDKTISKNTYASHAVDLREIVTSKKLTDVILIGWSSGCLTIYEYVRMFGLDNIQKLVFIDEPPKWIGDVSKEWVYGNFDDYRSTLKSLAAGTSNPNNIIDWMLQNSVDSTNRKWMVEEINMTPQSIALALFVDGMASDYTEEIRVINKSRVPVLFMLRDSWNPLARNWLKSAAPNAEIVSIASHAMFWEQPIKFNQLLFKFFTTKN